MASADFPASSPRDPLIPGSNGEITTEQENGNERTTEPPLRSTEGGGTLSMHSAVALLFSLQVGSGIFSSPSQVDSHAPSPGASLCVWIGSGLIAWAGAASFGELGAAIPVNGGMLEYLKYIYGDFLSLLAAWIWIFAVRPSSMAIMCIIFAEYWTNAIVPGLRDLSALNAILSLSALATIVLFNCISVDFTSRLNHFFSYWKLGTVGLLVLCCFLTVVFGFHYGEGEISREWRTKNWFAARQTAQSDVDWSTLSTWGYFGEYTTAFYAGLWAYAGWDNANMVAGEMKNPSRDLPRALHIAVPLVTACFVIANLVYYIIIPWETIGTSNAVAVMIGQRTLGTPGGVLFAVLVSMACIGSVNVSVFTTSRLTAAAAKSGYLPSFLQTLGFKSFEPLRHRAGPSRGDKRWITPINALVCNALVTSIYILLGSFASLVTFVGLAEYLFFFLTVLGVLILRQRQPSLRRPYRPAIWIPLLFTAASGLLTLRGILVAPIQAGVLAVLLLLGLAWHLNKHRLAPSSRISTLETN